MFFSVGTGASTAETPATIRASLVERFGEPVIKALEDGGVLKIVEAGDVPAGLLREGNADAVYRDAEIAHAQNKVSYLARACSTECNMPVDQAGQDDVGKTLGAGE